MANFAQDYGIKPMTSNVRTPTEQKKINLFDFSQKSTLKPNALSFIQQIQPTKQTPTIQQPTQTSGFSLVPQAKAEETNIIQSFLDDSKTRPELDSKRKAVIQMLQNQEDEDFIKNTIIKDMGYTGPKAEEQGFISGALQKTGESFMGGIKRIGEAGEGLANNKYTIPEAFARGGAGALQSAFSPFSGLIGETLETGIEQIPESIRTRIKQEATPTIEGVKEWYNKQSPEQKRNLDNIGVGVELLANFVGAKGVQSATPLIKQTGKGIIKGGENIVENIGKTPLLIKKGITKTSDIIDTGVEKAATKILGSSDGTKELFKATSPSYNTLSKNKDITRIVESAKKADETIVKYGYKPKNTTERVTAYNNTMKKVWDDISKIRSEVKTKFDAGNIAKTIDSEIDRLSVGGVINPAIQKDINALKAQSDYFKKIGKIDIPTLGNQRTLINAITDWGQTTEFGNTFSNVMKKVNSQIKGIEDDIITKAGKGIVGDKLRQYGALRSMYDDIVKQDIKALRAKGMAIDESFGRIAGISEALGGVAQLFTNPKQSLPSIISGGSKLLLGKTAGKLKDTDFLIKTGYDKLSKNLKPNLKKNASNVDNNISPTIKYSEKSTKISGQEPKIDTKIILRPKKYETIKKNLKSNGNAKSYDLSSKKIITPVETPKVIKTSNNRIITKKQPVLSDIGGVKTISPEYQHKFNQGPNYEAVRIISNQKDSKIIRYGALENKQKQSVIGKGSKLTEGEKLELKSIERELGLNREDIMKRSNEIKEMAKKVRDPYKEVILDLNKKPKSYDLSSKSGFIAPKRILSDVKKVVSPSDDLIKEARKYKSADEFVNSVKGERLLTGQRKDWKPKPLREYNPETDDSLFYGPGLYLTPTKEIAETYAQNGGVIHTVIADIKNPLKPGMKDWLIFIQKGNGKMKQDFLIRKGYDAVVDVKGKYKQVMIVNPEKVKTESQLKQIYEQANKPKLLKPNK